ncbi:N-acetylmuramoyl-L-alanine amidase [Terriglobus roseus]|uniref:N-acetylmuramoyl-L-alanine amidase n=1 Tax=Terriglobus roseus TaxID=392734 RepID=UPI00147B0613|nr:N-acetylmuramoyl-L-alanine amidase [Terriglobus roseus]
MNRLLSPVFFVASVSAFAQQPMVLLDPARGGSETGGRVAERIEEKQVTLQMATRLASLLRARGFDVELTRDADTTVTNDARAALANTTHPIACVLLHASAMGTGVHLYTTSLQQVNPDPSQPALWDAAQAAYAERSRAMAGDLASAFGRSKLPVSSGTTWMRPLDNMQCPAVAVEVSPQKDGTGPDDPTYENKVAEVIAGSMLSWRGRVASMTPAPPPPVPKPVVDAAPKPSGVTSVPAARPAGSGAVAKPLTAPATPAMPAVPKPAVPRPVVPKPSAPVGTNQ